MLKEGKLKVMTAFLSSKDVFMVLPIGFGKSLCYDCLPLALEELGEKGIDLVITA